MFKKFVTVVVIPQKTSTVKKIKIPITGFALISLLLTGLLLGWFWMIYDYFSLRTQLTKSKNTKSLLSERKEQVDEFVQGFDTVQLHFEQLQALNYRLRAFTGASDEQKKQNGQDDLMLQAQIEVASKEGILKVIASDSQSVETTLTEREIGFENLLRLYGEQKSPFETIPTEWPVRGFLVNEFGIQTDPFSRQQRPNHGIDIAAKIFSKIIAPASGVVIYSGPDDYYGTILSIDHGNGFVTRYGHIAQAEVSVGDLVKRGDAIAQVGSTGRTTGPRLHYEVIQNNIPRNPLNYIPK